jgi:hypothetical protein
VVQCPRPSGGYRTAQELFSSLVDCDDGDRFNWTAEGCANCVDNDHDLHYVYCDRWDFTRLGPDCDDRPLGDDGVPGTADDGANINGDAPDAECDHVDNNCDDVADNGVIGTTCGLGVCASTGQQSCVSDEVVDTCEEGLPDPGGEVCDGIDNDCSGLPDDHLTAPPADVTAGVCAVARKVCTGAGGWIEPDYGSIPGYESEEITCDSSDNDTVIRAH